MFRKKTTGLKAVKPVCLLLLAGACIIACAASVKRPGRCHGGDVSHERRGRAGVCRYV